jgi:phosphate transport system substrate-binding protein
MISLKKYVWTGSSLLMSVALFTACGGHPGGEKNTISISGAFALYPLTVQWAQEYKKLHPDVTIDVSAGGAGKGITDVLSGMTDIGLVSRSLVPSELQKGALAIAVAKDAVIPTISASNPLAATLQSTGVKKDDLNGIFITGTVKNWNQLGLQSKDPIHPYTRSDAAGAAETWASYFGKKQEDLQGTAVFGDPGLAQAVQKDPDGVGFNNIVFVYDASTKKPSNGVIPLPIDLNGNGKIDPEEAFYGTITDITQAIAAGKYPSPPARDLFFVTKGAVTNPVLKSFIQFILTDGQKDVSGAGYILLPADKIQEGLAKVK